MNTTDNRPSQDDREGVSKAFAAENRSLNKGIVARLEKLQEAWSQAQQDRNGVSNLGQRLDEKRRAIAKKLNHGEAIGPETAIVTRESVMADLQELAMLGRERQRQIGLETLEIAESVFPGLISAFDAWAMRKIEAEAALYREAGMTTFTAEKSHFASCLRFVGNHFRARYQTAVSNRSGGEPKNLFGFVLT